MHNPIIRAPLFSLIALAGALGGSPSYGQGDDPDPRQLAPVEVTARAEGQRTENVEAAVVEHYQATDLEDVFASQPEVSVGGGHGIAQKVYVRGVEDTLLNVTIDGAAQAGQVFHHTGRISIEPELLKRVEVQAGTGDATSGPGALGGALRFVTKDPDDMLRPNERAGALVKGTYFSNGEGFKLNTSVFGRLSEDWSAMAVATHQDRNDYKDGGGDTVPTTGARQNLGYLKLVGKLAADQTLRLSYDRREDSGVRTHRPQWVPSSFNRAYPLESERETWTLNYAFRPTGNDAVDLEVTAYHTSVDLTQDVFDRWGIYKGAVESSGVDLRNTSRIGAHTLTYGFDHRRDRVTAGPAGDSSAVEEDGSVTGLYVQDSIELTSRLLLGIGARYDRYRLNDANDQRFRDSGVSPNASLAYALTPNLTLLAGHARALRGVDVRDAFKLDSASNDPDLKPEKARTSELGFEYQQGAWRLGGKAYRTVIRDAISDPIGAPARYENIGDVRSKGALLHTGYDWQRLSVGLSFHYNDAEIDGSPLNVYEHNGLGTSVGNTWTLHADYRMRPGLDFGWQGRFVQRIDSLRTGVGEIDKPGYGVHDIYARWVPAGLDDLTLSLTVKNLFDKRYLDHASNEDFEHISGYTGIVGSREPGREIRVSAAMRF